MTKEVWVDPYTELCEFMANHVNEGDSVDVWNDYREAAKAIFTTPLISKLDASGYIKEFYLTPSEDRL